MNPIVEKGAWVMLAVGIAIYLFAILSAGCSTPPQPKMYDLLHEDKYKDYAYKSVTKKDYDPPKEDA